MSLWKLNLRKNINFYFIFLKENCSDINFQKLEHNWILIYYIYYKQINIRLQKINIYSWIKIKKYC